MNERASNDPERCPLCAAANECGAAAGKSTCWCFSEQIPAEVLARVPEGRSDACVCRRCASGAAAERAPVKPR